MNSLVITLSILVTVAYGHECQTRVIGGKQAEEGQFPYQVSLKYRGKHFCGGCILNKYWILTAAHCLDHDNGPVTIVSGTNSLSNGGDTYIGIMKIKHKRYNSSKLTNDIALVKVNKPIKISNKVQPIALNTDFIGAGANLTLSGWGLTKYPGVAPEKLQYIDLKSISNFDCAKRLEHVISNPINKTHICTFTCIKEGACSGDSGGPLVYKGTVAGIVSWGIPCAIGYPDVYTRVSVYKRWIEKKIKRN